jgi:hypothetical protein
MKHTFFLVFMTSIACLFDIATTEAADEVNSVCKDVGELAYGTKTKCVKGDLIMINPMLAAYLCDLSKSHIKGDKLIICHYVGYKRKERK